MESNHTMQCLPLRCTYGSKERGVWLGDYYGHERVHIQEGSMVETSMKENDDEKMFSIRALAFALLECRSEKEALLVIKYFTHSKSRVPASAKPVRRPDEPTEISK